MVLSVDSFDDQACIRLAMANRLAFIGLVPVFEYPNLAAESLLFDLGDDCRASDVRSSDFSGRAANEENFIKREFNFL